MIKIQNRTINLWVDGMSYFSNIIYNVVFHIPIRMCVLIFGFNLIMLIYKYLYIITNLLEKEVEDGWKHSRGTLKMANDIQGENVKV